MFHIMKKMYHYVNTFKICTLSDNFRAIKSVFEIAERNYILKEIIENEFFHLSI